MTATTTIPGADADKRPALTALARHAGFFDPAGTGEVRLGQTAAGMRRLGVKLVWRIVLPPIIQVFLGYLTQGRPSLVIRLDRIARGKHPFDTGTFDESGAIDAGAFEELFAGVDGHALTADEMRAVIAARGNRLPRMGKLAGVLGHWFSGKEVSLFFCVGADTTKVAGGRAVAAVSRETLRRFYDGTLFPDLARRRILVENECVLRRRPGASG
jgi:hypothetical protein